MAACNNHIGSIEGLNVWILSRTVNLDPKYLAEALVVLNANEIPYFPLIRTTQNCNYRSVL